MVDTPPNRPQEVRSNDHLQTARRDHGRGRVGDCRRGRRHRQCGRRDDSDNDAEHERGEHALDHDALDHDALDDDTLAGPETGGAEW